MLEKIYSNGLCWDLELKGWSIAQLMGFRVQYRDKEVGIYYADIVVDGKVIVEVKSVDRLDDIHRAQLLNYLRLSGVKVGLLINFSKTKLEYERLVD